MALGTPFEGFARVPLAAGLLLIASCAADNRSFDLGYGDEAPVYLDETTPAQRSATTETISAELRRGISAYHLQPGDRVDVLYYIDKDYLRPYRIGVGDELDLDFDFDRTLNHSVVVRPDGKISLPGKGEIVAFDVKPLDLGGAIAQRYKDVALEPVVTVSVRRFTTAADALIEVVRNGVENRSRSAVVRPDGLIDLPLAGGLRAAGLTPEELQDELDARYRERVGGVRTTVQLTTLGANQIFVFGEVKQPGGIPAPTPRTLLQTVAAAGGSLPTGALDQVRVLYLDALGRPRLRRVNLEAVMENLRVEEDLIVPPNSTVYVPPTALAKAGRFVDQVFRQIIQYNGVTIGITPFTPFFQPIR
jgi:polysaccharide export outer membrane protein